MNHLQGFCNMGVAAINGLQLAAGGHLLIPTMPTLGGAGAVDFTVTVASRAPFELRVAAPGARVGTAACVDWVSGRE